MRDDTLIIEMFGERNLISFGNITSFTQGLASISLTYEEYAPFLLRNVLHEKKYFSLISFSVQSPPKSIFETTRGWVVTAAALVTFAAAVTSGLADYPQAKVGYRELSHDVEERIRQAQQLIRDGLNIFGGDMHNELPILLLAFLESMKDLPVREAYVIILRGARLNGQIMNRHTRPPHFKVSKKK